MGFRPLKPEYTAWGRRRRLLRWAGVLILVALVAAVTPAALADSTLTANLAALGAAVSTGNTTAIQTAAGNLGGSVNTGVAFFTSASVGVLYSLSHGLPFLVVAAATTATTLVAALLMVPHEARLRPRRTMTSSDTVEPTLKAA